MELDLDDAVLLSIDMQQAFDVAPWPRRWNQAVDANGLALLAAWRAAKRPIIHVRHDSVQSGSTLAAGAPGNAFRPGFGPQDNEPLVTKSVNSAFIGTDLDEQLKELGAKHVVAFGISTDMCVSTTVRMGTNLGWDSSPTPATVSTCLAPMAGRGSRPSRSTQRTSRRSPTSSAGSCRRPSSSEFARKRLVFAAKCLYWRGPSDERHDTPQTPARRAGLARLS